ncbi:MAG TPA: SAM-dependent methyltransferase [Acidimicrobiales bacterium]|jgi:methyltransferase (TIGR00027 family)|nr:SAM-dependent methyltransferase [Acidimicrobiales bacterium]
MARGTTSTFNGAAARRAVHSRYERPPILDDTWAIRLIDRKTRWIVRVPPLYRRYLAPEQQRSSGFFAFAIRNLRLADELVDAAVARGVDQYVILGAGLDSFGVRRQDLADRLRVYELDQPEAQAVKRARLERAAGRVPANVELVPIDFETTSIPVALAGSSYDGTRPCVVSWLNTISYLTEDAVIASLRGLANVMAPGSRLLFNYPPRVPLTDEQKVAGDAVRASVQRRGEPFRSVYLPEHMVELVGEAGLAVEEHLTDADLAKRYPAPPVETLRMSMPARTIVARRD